MRVALDSLICAGIGCWRLIGYLRDGKRRQRSYVTADHVVGRPGSCYVNPRAAVEVQQTKVAARRESYIAEVDADIDHSVERGRCGNVVEDWRITQGKSRGHSRTAGRCDQRRFSRTGYVRKDERHRSASGSAIGYVNRDIISGR